MTSILHGDRNRRFVFGAICALTMFACAARAQDVAQSNVLILHSNQRPTPAGIVIEETLRTTISATHKRPVEVFSEYLDVEVSSKPGLAAEQMEFLAHKYEARNIGVFVASAPGAVPFAIRLRERMSSAASIVHLAMPRDTLAAAKLPPYVFGRPVDLDPTPTLKLALQLHPGTRRVVVVLGATERDRIWARRVREAAPRMGDGLDFEYTTGLTTTEILQRAGALGRDSVIYTPGYFSDSTGEIVTPRRSVERLAKVSSVPVYGALDTFLDSGIVGGSMAPYDDQARQAGIIVSRLLDGATRDEIDTSPIAQVAIVDWRQVRRWGIDESLLPAGTIVRFREPSAWEKYRVEVSIGIAILLLQTVLISGLLLQRVGRRRAEEASSALAGRLLTAHEDERCRLARDLHDDVTQRLARLAIDASALERQALGVAGKVAARTVREDLVRLSGDVHALSYRLHPSIIDDLGLAEAIKGECGRLSTQESIAVNVDVGAIPEQLPRESALCLFRIAQEALRNVIRHAHANVVGVSLTQDRRGLRLVVRDDGRGFDASDEDRHPSLGHVSMRERAKQAGGTLRIDSEPGRGTTVSAWVPLGKTA